MASVGADQIRDTFFDLLARYGVLAFLYEEILSHATRKEGGSSSRRSARVPKKPACWIFRDSGNRQEISILVVLVRIFDHFKNFKGIARNTEGRCNEFSARSSKNKVKGAAMPLHKAWHQPNRPWKNGGSIETDHPARQGRLFTVSGTGIKSKNL